MLQHARANESSLEGARADAAGREELWRREQLRGDMEGVWQGGGALLMHEGHVGIYSNMWRASAWPPCSFFDIFGTDSDQAPYTKDLHHWLILIKGARSLEQWIRT